MKLIIREAKIIDSQSSFHNQTVDLQIENGILTKLIQTFKRKQF